MFYQPFIRSKYLQNIHPETPEEIDIEDALDEDVILRFRPIGNNTYDTGDIITFQITVKNPYYYQAVDVAINDENGFNTCSVLSSIFLILISYIFHLHNEHITSIMILL